MTQQSTNRGERGDSAERGSKRSPWRGFGAVAAVILVLLLAAHGLSRTEAFRNLVLDELVESVDGLIVGSFHARTIEGSLWTRFSVHDIELRHRGELVARLERVEIEPDWLAVLGGRVRMAHVEIVRPVLEIELQPDGSSGLTSALTLVESNPSKDAEAAETAQAMPIVIETLALVEGSIRIEPFARERAPGETEGEGDDEIRIQGLEARSRVFYSDRGLDLALRRLNAEVNRADLPRIEVEAEARLQTSGGEQRLAIESVRLRTDDSVIAASGELQLGHSLDVVVEIDRLGTGDLERLWPALASTPDLRGRLDVEGPWTASSVDGQLEWGTASLTAAATLDLTSLDPRTVDARVEMVVEDLSQWLPQSELAGHLELKARIDAGQGYFESQLGHPGGSLDATGSFSIQQAPRMQVKVHTTDLDMAKIWLGHPELAGQLALELEAKLDASEADLSDLRVAADFDIGDSQIGRVQVYAGRGLLRVEERKLHVSALCIDSNVGSLSVEGEVGIETGATADLEGKLDITDLGPLLALAGRSGQGTVEGELSLEGELEDLRLGADLRLAEIQLSNTSVERGQLSLSASGDPRRALRGSGRLTLSELKLPFFEGDVEMDLSGSGMQTQSFALTLTAEHRAGYTQSVETHGTVEGNRVRLVLDDASVASTQGVWKLAAPARIDLSREALSLEPVRFENEEASLSMRGAISQTGTQGLQIEARALPIEPILAFATTEIAVGGSFDLDLALEGTAASPRLEVAFDAKDLELEGSRVASATARLDVDSGVADLSLSILQDADRQIEGHGTLPVEFRWSPGWILQPRGEIDFRAESEAFALGFLSPLAVGHATKIEGQASLALGVRGPPDRPDLHGRILLEGVSFTPAATRVGVADLNAELVFDQRAIVLRSLSAKAREGALHANGTLQLGAGKLESISTNLSLERWPLIDSRSYHVVASGALEAKGPPSALTVEGLLAVDEGILRPELDFLSEQPTPRDESIELAHDPDAIASDTAATETDQETAQLGKLYDGLALAVDIDAGSELRVRHENARALLVGNVKLLKSSEGPLRLGGRIQTQRGWIDLLGRRFRLVDGVVSFTEADEIDPELDVLARHKTRDYTIDATVVGVASAPSLALTSDPELEQSDILSVLLFGRPVNDLREEEQASLAAEGAATDLGLSMAGKTISSSMRLDDIGIQIEELSQERATVGSFLARNTFISVTQEYGEDRGQKISVEYEFWPGWSIVTSTSSFGESSADVVWRLQY